MPTSTRDTILHNFGQWTASSATRSFSTERVCRALSALDFDGVLLEDKDAIVSKDSNAGTKLK